jgi:hypothetical protein
MGVELAVVSTMIVENCPHRASARDIDSYMLERIGANNIVVAVIQEIGNNIATTVDTPLFDSFKPIRFGLLLGGGGVSILQRIGLIFN